MSTPSPIGEPAAPPANNAVGEPQTLISDSIPPRWLEQIREAVKADRPSLVWALLGSSVLAALIGAGASMGATYLTIKASGDLEIKKVQLAARQSEINATLASYDQLDSKLGQLLEQFRGVATLVQIERSNHAPAKRNRAADFRSKFEQLGVAEGAILALKTDSHLDPKVWDKVDKSLTEIASAISNTDSDLAAFSAAADSIEADLTDALSEVRHAKGSVTRNPGVIGNSSGEN